MPDVEFVSAGNSTDVKTDRLAVMASLRKVAIGTEIVPLVDRDSHSDDERRELQKEGYRVLSRRHIESYLFDDEVLELLCDSVGRAADKAAVLKIKSDAIADSVGRQNFPDDIKKAAGQMSDKIARLLGIARGGASPEEFERNILSPLVTPQTRTYQELEKDIFGTSPI
jgi:hypothetical protein